ncbi:MAG: septum formation protein Maf [Lachnospiraceae bacterium]|nr:septum formation protein Maf [Lachnospiraceae bacterium]
MKYILASGSPRRREILSRMGFDFELCTPEVSEEHGDIPVWRLVCELSARKAYAAAELCGRDCVVIAADTMVAAEGKLLGKPKDRAESERMVRMLSGNTHQVYTGVCLIRLDTEEMSCFSERSNVMVRELSEEEIREYVDSGEGDDKAGAYAIQGAFGKYVTGYTGERDNIIGLPSERLKKELELLMKEE